MTCMEKYLVSGCVWSVVNGTVCFPHTPGEKSHQRPCENVFVVVFMGAQITTETTDSHVEKGETNQADKVTSTDDRW